MKWFGKNSWRSREVTLTDQLCRVLEGWQRRIADRLNVWLNSLAAWQLRFWLLLGCVVVSGYLYWVVWSALGSSF